MRKQKNAAGEPLFPNLSKSVFALLCLPVSNIAVERVFSQVSVTKTDHRNRMTRETLQMILHVRWGLKESYGCCENIEPDDRFMTKINTAAM